MIAIEAHIPLHISFLFLPLCRDPFTWNSLIELSITFPSLQSPSLSSLFWYRDDVPKMKTTIHSLEERKRQAGREGIAGFEEKTQLRLCATISRTPIFSSSIRTSMLYVARVVYPSIGPSRSLDIFDRSTLFHPRRDLLRRRHHGGTKMCESSRAEKGCRTAAIAQKYRVPVSQSPQIWRKAFPDFSRSSRKSRLRNTRTCCTARNTFMHINKISRVRSARDLWDLPLKIGERDWETKFLNRAGYE